MKFLLRPVKGGGGVIGFEGLRLWKFVAVVESGDDRRLVLGLCSGESCYHCGVRLLC